MRWRVAVAVTSAFFAAFAACGSIDPAVPYALPDDDWSVGVSGAVVWDERGSPVRSSGGMIGVEAAYIDDVFGLNAGVRVQREGGGERVSGLVEATAWYVLLFGVGARVGGTIDDAGPGVPGFAADLTFLIGLPIPLWHDCVNRTGALVIVPYARPGFRIGRSGSGDPDPDGIRGFHELGVMLRWTSFAF